MLNTKKCLICKRSNNTVHWHRDEESGDIWCWCTGTCQRGYSLYSYCSRAGISLPQFLKADFTFEEAIPNTVNKMEWPAWYLPLSDPRAKQGSEYVQSRGLESKGDIYYDSSRNGIIFPYYFHNVYVGAQIRFIEPEEDHKLETVPGTRTGLLFYGWNQDSFITNIKGVIITEGAFNALAIQQSLDKLYGGTVNNPWRCMAVSGSGATKHQLEKTKELLDNGYKIVIAPDNDNAGLDMLKKFIKNKALTHYAFTGVEKADWNDLFIKLGQDKFADFFLKSVKKAGAL